MFFFFFFFSFLVFFLYKIGFLNVRVSLHGRVCLVTGAGSGIGRQLALTLARTGANLVLWDMDGIALGETKRLVEQIGVANGMRIMTQEVDITDEEKVAESVQDVLREMGGMEIVINNAG